jgi:hypothetical protein
MHTGPDKPVAPPMPEFPAAVAAAFLIMAAICSVAPFHDRYILAAIAGTIGLASAIVAILNCRVGNDATPTGSGHH